MLHAEWKALELGFIGITCNDMVIAKQPALVILILMPNI